ncbi:MAG TPA: tetratricopeptide repeat protein [Gemmataceae bacterium]|jgi:tetratricopeptide (TPR) repeat protein
MNDNNSVNASEADLAWLKADDPEIYHLLRALDGDLDALRWLKLHGDGLFLFVEALTGAKEAVDSLEAQPTDKLIDLFDTIAHCDVEEWLHENHTELQRLFAFVRGDDTALRGLKQRRAICKRVGEIVRAKYRDYRDEDSEEAAPVAEGAAADVGCLIGEMHLQQQEYHKAIEAFSRAIESDPTPDAYAGRARAYRALAALDDHAAAEAHARTAR